MKTICTILYGTKLTAHNLNDSGEGMFQEQPRDEGHNQNNDDEKNDLQLTKSGEVYIRPLMISLHVVIDLALIN